MRSTIKCPNCGALNRVEPRSGKSAVCGRCAASLAAAGPLTVTDANFSGLVDRSEIPVVIDFWADWCPPCKMLAPTIGALASELAGRAVVGKLDVDHSPETANRFGVRSIPTIIIFKGGHEVDRLVGVQPRESILRQLGLNG